MKLVQLYELKGKRNEANEVFASERLEKQTTAQVKHLS